MGEHQHRQNRVTPFGTFEATPARGLFMGNRGPLLRPDGTLRPWRSRAWICCLTSFRGRRVPLDNPKRYTPLFFLDEAVALAAGHRPCAECRRADYLSFKQAFRRAFRIPDDAPLSAVVIDAVLHEKRIHGRRTVVPAAAIDSLPDGTFVTHDDSPRQAYLVAAGAIHPWSHAGYGKPLPIPMHGNVSVLTPKPIVDVLRAGYPANDGRAFHPVAERCNRLHPS